MKKHVKLLSTFLALIMVFSVIVPTVAFADKAYEAKEITAYLYSMDKSTTIECLFDPDLPSIPYIDACDYLQNIYTVEFTETKNEDGTYTVESKNGAMIVDLEKDTVHFDNYEQFSGSDVYMEGSSIAADFIEEVDTSYIGEFKALDLDLGKYDIDIIEYNGKVYFPMPSICDIFISTYNGAEYIDGVIYFSHTFDNIQACYFDRSSGWANEKRDQALIDYTYNEICFQMDYIYGMPSKAEVSSAKAEKDFDVLLDEYNDDTRKAKELLKSENTVDFYYGLAYLCDLYRDGGHTNLLIEAFTAVGKLNTAGIKSDLGSEFLAALTTNDDEKSAKALNEYGMGTEVKAKKSSVIKAERLEAFKNYEVINDNEKSLFVKSGDIGIFYFDSFENAIVTDLHWALENAADLGVKKFVIDLATNGGGSSAVLQYILAIITNKNNKTNTITSLSLNTMTGNLSKSTARLDLNLDGKIDDADKDVYYDYDFAMLATGVAFSCGNLLPVLAAEAGIPVYGEASGGGTCNLLPIYFGASHFYTLSGPSKFLRGDLTDVDTGCKIEKEIKKPLTDDIGAADPAIYGIYDFSDLFDAEIIGAAIDEFYGNETPVTEPVETEPETPVTQPQTTPKTGSDSMIVIFALIAVLSLAAAYKKIRTR